MKSVIFVCGGNDYHAIDWFHVVKDLCPKNEIIVASDINKNQSIIIKDDDKVVHLFDISRFLLKKQSTTADIWRNLVKLLSTPVQLANLRKLSYKYPDSVFHAHSMYYIFMCWLAGIKFVATPMGSDVLVRPDKSRIYKFFTRKSLKAASLITVDSIKMQDKVMELSGKQSSLIQNGIDVASIRSFLSDESVRKSIVSIRGFYLNYRIEEIIRSRNNMINPPAITFIYPFYESNYHQGIKRKLSNFDIDMGRLSKEDLYSLLSETLLVLSIPESDSSPRSVYEAIFCGCAVAVTYSPWIDLLPACMAARITVVDLENPSWFQEAMIIANKIASQSYIPSREALELYDQVEAMKIVCKEVYNINL